MVINENCECCKQLAKRLEELDAEFECHANEVTDLEMKLLNKQEELELLKTSYKVAMGIIKEHEEELKTLQELKDEDSLRVVNLGTKCTQLEQTLQEIKEIANMCLCEDDMSNLILEKCEVVDD